MARPILLWTVFLVASLTSAILAREPELPISISASDLDPAGFVQWVEGTESSINNVTPDKVLWTQNSKPGYAALPFGQSGQAGPRHLRLSFKKPQRIGSLLVRGGGSISYLPAGQTLAKLDDPQAWKSATRLLNGQPSTDEVRANEYAVWSFPPNSQVLALRFTHTAALTDTNYAGSLGGLWIFPDRLTNLAPLAQATASSRSNKAGAINDSDPNYEAWQSFDPDAPTDRAPISSDRPEWLMLTWPEPVQLAGLCAISAGFASAEAQAYVGPADRHPRDASANDWQSIDTFTSIVNGYANQLYPNVLRFAQPVTTRAVRLRLTSPTNENHPHLRGKTKDGRNVWIGELLALHDLRDQPLRAMTFENRVESINPPIPVRFKLDQPGYVTLVIEDNSGKRVRNLVSETYFPAGENVAWWDATDDLQRDPDAAKHGLYRIPAHLVAPATYRVRGLVRQAIEPRYEFSIYNPGTPPWETADTSGAWLANHSPPQAALFLPADVSPTRAPQVLLGSYVTEGGSGFAVVDLQGKKLSGRGWIGGVWTGAPFLARDEGPKRIPAHYTYVASVWNGADLRITALTEKGDKAIVNHRFTPANANQITEEINGLAVRDGVIVVSLTRINQLVFIDAASGKILATPSFDSPRGLGFDREGNLLVLGRDRLVQFSLGNDLANLGSPQTRVTGLEDAQQLTLDSAGNVYISDLGQSHQVKVFTRSGQWLRTIGKPGAPGVGPYDPDHMNTPAGLTIDSQNQLWVAERNYLPKRVSVWSLEGKLIRAFYGPGKYGGGGTIDREDKTLFYYAEEQRGTLVFKLDWQTGASRVERVLYREGPGVMPLATNSAAPESTLFHSGQRYFANCYNSHPTGGANTGFLFIEKDGIARPVSAIGRANDWDVLKSDAFKPRWPKGVDISQNPYAHNAKNQAIFVWSDLNGDAQAQPDEVVIEPCKDVSGVTIDDDLHWCIARVAGQSKRFAPTEITNGVPKYDLASAEVIVDGIQQPASSGGNQIVPAGKGEWSAVTLGIKPFAAASISGSKAGVPMWSYPSLWPGLHAAHEAPTPDRPGQLIGTTRLLGRAVTPRGSDIGPLFAVNGNMGNVYLFSADGLFVATLFKDKRLGKTWSMPSSQRNMLLADLTLNEENFWPTISQTSDGNIYLVDGTRLALIRLDGLDTLRRITAPDVTITTADLEKAQRYLVDAESARQKQQGRGVMEIAITSTAPVVDGKLDDWANATWVDIDKSGVAAYFNSSTKPYNVTGAIRVSGDRLYVAYRSNEEKLLENTGEMPTAPFKTGGGLDLMLGTNPSAPATRSQPVAGDLRVLVTRAKGKSLAMLYQPVFPGSKEKVPFSSPWRTIALDRVVDISNDVQLAGQEGNYEFSVPLSVLGLKPQAGAAIQGDLGILRGNGFQTTARVYWSNKSTGITSDVPSEAMLAPQLWGRMEFTSGK